MNTKELLHKLTSCVGVSGAEENVITTIKEIVEPIGEVTTDNMNNLYCTFGSGTHFLLDAHIDQIGFIVKEITNDGFIKVAGCGGIDCRMLSASEVSVWGDKEYRGIISTLPPHLQNKNNQNVQKIDEISIDVGFDKETAEKHIKIGDRVTFKNNFYSLFNNQICAGSLDDRCGVATIILAAKKLKNINAKITLLFSSQEEVGTRGAKIGAFDKDVDEAIVVDVSFGYSPLCNKKDCGEIGKGAMIGFSPILDRKISKELCVVAENNSIPYQKEIMGGGRTGTNADVISITEKGIKTALVSIPQKYMHSPVEIIELSDIENTANLIAEYIISKVGELDA